MAERTAVLSPTHALIFAIDFSKTQTGVAVIRMPFIWTDDQLPILIATARIRAEEVAAGAQRIWWPTAHLIYHELKRIIVEHRAAYSFDYPIVAYEGAAWGQATSEMMVWLQQRVFEWMDSDPVTNLDLVGLTPAGARSFARMYSGTDHHPKPKTLSSNIVIDLAAKGKVTNLTPELAAPRWLAQDEKDAIVIGVAAGITTTQFIVTRELHGEIAADYGKSQQRYDELAFQAKRFPKLSHSKPTHPANLRLMIRELAKRDEPHLSTANPYIYPARTLRLLGRATETAGPQGYKYSIGLTKVGLANQLTLVHDHDKAV